MESFLTLTFRRNAAADDLDHIVQISNDLSQWRAGANHVVLVDSIDHADGTITEVWRSVTPISSSGGESMRVEVTLR